MSERLRSTPLAESKWRAAHWLVIAPHADDETIGCGALIAQTAAEGRLAGVAFLTDGGASHACNTPEARRSLVSVRQQEARAALRILAPQAPPPFFLRWPDASPHPIAGSERHATIRHLQSFCARHRVDAIAVTGRDEPHCDHVAAWQVAQTVAVRAFRPTRVFEYIVWSEHPPVRGFEVIRTKPLAQGRRSLALAQHRSQLTPLYGEGFTVPPAMQRMPSSDLLYTQAPR